MKNRFETIVYFDDEKGNPTSEEIPGVPKEFAQKGLSVEVTFNEKPIDLVIFSTEQDRDGTMHVFCAPYTQTIH